MNIPIFLLTLAQQKLESFFISYSSIFNVIFYNKFLQSIILYICVIATVHLCNTYNIYV